MGLIFALCHLEQWWVRIRTDTAQIVLRNLSMIGRPPRELLIIAWSADAKFEREWCETKFFQHLCISEGAICFFTVGICAFFTRGSIAAVSFPND